MRALAAKFQNRLQVLKDLETHSQTLLGEFHKVKEENKSLSEMNVSSPISMRYMQNEISSLSEAKGKLELEVELRMDQRNALQQKIYCLEKELNDHNRKLLSIVTQVQAVGLDPECFESSVKELQDEKSNLGETCEREKSEKVALLEKLQVFEELLKKNSILENSQSDLSAELEAVRGSLMGIRSLLSIPSSGEICKSLHPTKSINYLHVYLHYQGCTCHFTPIYPVLGPFWSLLCFPRLTCLCAPILSSHLFSF